MALVQLQNVGLIMQETCFGRIASPKNNARCPIEKDG